MGGVAHGAVLAALIGLACAHVLAAWCLCRIGALADSAAADAARGTGEAGTSEPGPSTAAERARTGRSGSKVEQSGEDSYGDRGQ